MLPGTRVLVDVDPLLISSNPRQLAALRTVLAALQQAPPPRQPRAAWQAHSLMAEDSTLPGQLLPEVTTALRSCRYMLI